MGKEAEKLEDLDHLLALSLVYDEMYHHENEYSNDDINVDVIDGYGVREEHRLSPTSEEDSPIRRGIQEMPSKHACVSTNSMICQAESTKGTQKYIQDEDTMVEGGCEHEDLCNDHDSDNDDMHSHEIFGCPSSSDNGSGYEFVFHGIDSIDEITIEYIENCSYVPDLEQLYNSFMACGNQSPDLVDSVRKRLATLQQQQQQQQQQYDGDDHNDHNDDDDYFVVVAVPPDNTSVKPAPKKSKSDIATNCSSSSSNNNNNNNDTNVTITTINTPPKINPPELTPMNLRSVIESYSKNHPDDVGMPMRNLMKKFKINKQTPFEQQNLFQQIVNQQCLLETTDEIGRVLFLKEFDDPCDFAAPASVLERNKNDEESNNHNDDGDSDFEIINAHCEAIDDDRKTNAVTIEYIQNCSSIRELQCIISRLGQSNYSLPNHINSAMERLTTLRETIDFSEITATINDDDDDYDEISFSSDDDDCHLPDLDSLTVEYIENCTSVRLLKIIIYRLATKQAATKQAAYTVTLVDQATVQKDLAQRIVPTPCADLHKSARKRLRALECSGRMHIASRKHLPTPKRRVPKNEIEDLDFFLAMSLSVDYDDSDGFCSDCDSLNSDKRVFNGIDGIVNQPTPLLQKEPNNLKTAQSMFRK